MLGSLVFVVSALLELAFVVLVSRVPSHVEKNLHDDEPGTAGNFNTRSFSQMKIASKESSMPNTLKAEKELFQGQKKMKTIPNIPPVHIVDLISFNIYLFFFILFNGIYWISY